MNPTLGPLEFAALQRAPMFSGFSKAALKDLGQHLQVVRHERGRLLFHQGDPADRFFLVLDGWVRVFRDTAEGEQTVLHLVRPGETFAEPAVLNLGRYPAAAEAATDSRVVEVPKEAFEDAMRKDPELALRVIGILCQRLRFMVAEMEQRQVKSAPQRLACFLASLSEANSGAVSLRLPYDKALLAGRLGMQPESLSRALRKLRSVGVTSHGNVVEVGDMGKLLEVCERGV